MKTLNVLFLLTFGLFFVNCTDNNDDPQFDGKFLEQTTWEGIAIVTDGDLTISTMNVLMQFFTADSGQYIVKQNGLRTQVYDFEYTLIGKLITIDGGNLSSIWTLIEFNKDKMVLETFSSYKFTLTITKKY